MAYIGECSRPALQINIFNYLPSKELFCEHCVRYKDVFERVKAIQKKQEIRGNMTKKKKLLKVKIKQEKSGSNVATGGANI